MITDDCINCGACEAECPNTAIYEPGMRWTMADGTKVERPFTLETGMVVEPGAEQAPINEDFYFLVADKCTECVGFHDEPQCAAVCPVDCCLPDPERVESESVLLARQITLHGPA